MNRFEPRPTLRNGHWMTLYSWGNPRYFPALPPPARRYFDVSLDAPAVPGVARAELTSGQM